MTPPGNLGRPSNFPGLNLADNLRRELQLQQIAMSASIQWGVYPVILMAAVGLWQQVAHLPLVLWCVAICLVSLASVVNAQRNRSTLLTVITPIPDFTKRNTMVYLCVGSVWG